LIIKTRVGEFSLLNSPMDNQIIIGVCEPGSENALTQELNFFILSIGLKGL